MNLKEIVECFNAPIKEEQAWAVCHQCGKYLKKQESENIDLSKPRYTAPEGLHAAYFGENGLIDLLGEPTEFSEEITLGRVGLVVFSALNYGLGAHQEQEISLSLDDVISRMTAHLQTGADEEYHDEGYDGDKQTTDTGYQSCTIDELLTFCESRLSQRWEADAHYTAVCSAMLREAQELKIFLSKVESANQSLRKLTQVTSSSRDPHAESPDEIPNLGFADWAHLWMQVLDQLRKGVTRLKKVEQQTRNSVEYELTPYEILMEDIRQKKYTLKKVTQFELLPPQVKKSAHDVILEFIRSRPNLSPAHQRILAPTPPRSKSLHEQLIEQIHEQAVPLRSIDNLSIKPSRTFDVGKRPDTESIVGMTSSKSCRRILKLENLSDDENDSFTESDSDYDVTCGHNDVNTTEDLDQSYSPFRPFNRSATSSARSSGTSGVSSSSHGDASELTPATHRPLSIRFSDSVRRKRLLPLELPPSPAKTPTDSPAGHLPSFVPSFLSKLPSRALRRSQSVALRSNHTPRPSLVDRKITWLDPLSPESTTKNDVMLPPPPRSPVTAEEKRQYFRRTKSERKRNTTVDCSDWQQPVASLSLTVEEVMHIRQVLTRAELEKFQSDKELYRALKNEKVCFTCRTKKFTVFSWPNTCEICKMKICSKCTRKVRAPTNKYLETPVFTLSPSMHKMSGAHSVYSFTRFDSKHQPVSPINLLREQYQRDSGESITSQIWNRSRKMDVCCECHLLLSGVVNSSREVARQHIYTSNAA
uniref:KIND domain-containing protein n=1 Tax=Ciona savignyi TaxID=51511 RepID=H2ZQL7_CIOSA